MHPLCMCPVMSSRPFLWLRAEKMCATNPSLREVISLGRATGRHLLADHKAQWECRLYTSPRCQRPKRPRSWWHAWCQSELRKALGSNYENQKAARQNAAPLLANVALTKMGQAGQGAYNRTSSDPNVRSGSLTKLRPPTPPRKLEELAAEAAAAAAAQQAGDQSAAHMTQQAYSHAQQHIYSQQQTPQMSQAQQQAHTSARMSQPNRMSSSYSAGSSPGMSRSAQPRGSMSSRGSDYMQPRTPTQQGSTGTRPVSGPSRYAPRPAQ